MRLEQIRPEPLKVIPAPPRAKSSKMKSESKPLCSLVATQIREMLEREDINLVLAVFGFLRDTRPCVIGGSEVKGTESRHEYGFDAEGPFHAMFKLNKFSSEKDKLLYIERISPEELLEHTDDPKIFLQRIHYHLEGGAQAILRREARKKRMSQGLEKSRRAGKK